MPIEPGVDGCPAQYICYTAKTGAYKAAYDESLELWAWSAWERAGKKDDAEAE